MKKILFLIIFLCSMASVAQRQANNWYFGDRAGLDFNRPNPQPLLDGELQAFEGCSSMSDSDGNLLFYTNGIVVYNRNHEIMLNGDGLNGDTSSTQSAIIVPKPLSPNVYYLFTLDAGLGDDGLQYSEVDMTLDGGLGGITANKNVPLAASMTEKLTGTASTVPTEYWVVAHRRNSDEFLSFNITSTGINTTPVVSAVGTFIPDTFGTNLLGQMKISPDGTKLATAAPGEVLELQLFDFNATTGEVTNAQTIMDVENDPTLPLVGPYGLAFSPDSNLLYTTLLGFGVYQFNTEAGTTQDIIDSRVGVYTTPGDYSAMQLGPDERIYIASFGNQNIDRIESPNTIGVACDYQAGSVSLGGRTSAVGLPSFIQSFLLPSNIIFENQCFGDETSFSIEDSVTSIIWDFGDPASGANNTSTEETPTHIFSAPGTYTVTVTAFQGSVSIDFSRDIVIYDTPFIDQQPMDLEVCDADNNGVEIFDLSVQTPIILGPQDPNIFQVNYFSDATFTTFITDPTNYQNTAPSETIYFRVSNANNPTCFVTGSFMVSIGNGITLPNTIEDYEVCDDDTDGFVNSFLLSTKDAEILQNLDPTLFDVHYFETENDAINDVNAIDKFSPYQNIVANIQTIYVRVFAISNTQCADTSKQFNLVVNQIPVVNPIVELRQCDDDTDGFSIFNLNEAAQEVSANFANETFVFYPTLADAQNDTNAIADPIAYQNQTVTTDTVWVRTIRPPDCFAISEVRLIVSTTLIPSTFAVSYEACDDFLDEDGNDTANNDDTDGITFFDFSNVNQQVVDLFPPTQQLVIAYYRNEIDALTEQNPIADISNYRNIGFPNTQQIYIRVDSQLDNDCLGLGPFITLTVTPVPTAEPVGDLEVCDTDTDGIIDSFNLDTQTPIILGTQNPADFTVTYHTSSADASAGVNAIANTSMYTNITPNLQTIYVRVTNNNTQCFTAQTTFDLIVNQIPIANPVPDLEICDDDSDGSARNGFSQSFDLEALTPTILGSQDPNQFTVTYHASLSDAQNGVLPLLSPFSNSIPFSQTIYVRVVNGGNGCTNGITSFDVIVNPEPTFAEVSNLSYCDDDLDGDDTNGFVQNIDLDSQILGILDFDNTGQAADDFTVTFHETQADATDGNNALVSPYSNTIANQQTIYVRIANNTTGCINDDFTFDIVVNPLPDFQVTSPQIVCLNGPVLTLFVESPATIYDYVWTDPTGNMIIDSEINITRGGLYTVTATSTDGTNCSRTREIQVNESIIATITEDDVTIVDDSENNSVTIDTASLGIGDYEFALADEENFIVRSYQDDPIFENLEGGFYTILVRDKNGCGVASLDVSVVEFPKFFTPNNDGFNDTWLIKGVNSIFFEESQINIFNRFGKLVAQVSTDSDEGWDGTYNSDVLPSDDYWFSVRLVDRNGILRERQGNFSLLRR